MSLGNTPSHVPAWKRIGLKLKYAKETVGEPSTAEQPGRIVAENEASKRSDENDRVESSRPAKKRKTSKKLARDAEEQNVIPLSSENLSNTPSSTDKTTAQSTTTSNKEDNATNFNTSQQHHEQDQKPLDDHSNGPTRRKSVTFTPETKQGDGFEPFSSAKKSSVVLAIDGTASSESSRPQDSPTPSKKERKKRCRDQRSGGSATSTSNGESTNKELPDYLEYLSTFHNYRQNWKFNKRKQTLLLKNLFNVHQIPSGHNQALLGYINGLQGHTIRKKLIEDATAVLAEIAAKDDEIEVPNDMELSSARRAAYRAALQRQVDRYNRLGAQDSEYDDQQVAEMKQEIERGERADSVLEELLKQELTGDLVAALNGSSTTTNVTSSQSSSKSGEKPKRKKRKTRTQNNSESSSSDESSSDEDNERASGHNSRRSTQNFTTAQDALRAARAQPKQEIRPLNNDKLRATGTKKIFDDALLDKMFPTFQSRLESERKRKREQDPKTRRRSDSDSE